MSPNLILLLKVASPCSDISSVRAVISEPPSLPLNIKSLSETSDLITTSLELNPPIVPTRVPSSLNNISPPPASRIMSPGVSKVMFPEEVPIVTAASPVVISSAAELPPLPPGKLDTAVFLIALAEVS